MLGFMRSRRIVKQPRLPDGIRVYAFGDIHGRSDLLKKMFTMIDTDMERNPANRSIEVFLGDYVDRGPDSAQTLDLLLDRSLYRETVFLKGNHEAFFQEVLRDPGKLED